MKTNRIPFFSLIVIFSVLLNLQGHSKINCRQLSVWIENDETEYSCCKMTQRQINRQPHSIILHCKESTDAVMVSYKKRTACVGLNEQHCIHNGVACVSNTAEGL